MRTHRGVLASLQYQYAVSLWQRSCGTSELVSILNHTTAITIAKPPRHSAKASGPLATRQTYPRVSPHPQPAVKYVLNLRAINRRENRKYRSIQDVAVESHRLKQASFHLHLNEIAHD
jgi:hypothetical protein